MKKEIIKRLWVLIKELNSKDRKKCCLEVKIYKKGITGLINCDNEINNSYFSIGELGSEKNIIGNAIFKQGTSKADLISIVSNWDLP
ncbi:hypothetical protein QLS31_06150 [Flavobacterium sp. XS2P24]|uniref:hypothetical protein n=1 Tax=Flavobacterium sp. XS2P24 TaxID=3041249 RepID=UPI0024A87530|nr:hypothetical protein [Flavobacterium sp. XS2P24]MDI6049404.1 hypothetical protein [Flavobacterium sp. XS2P24]